MVDVVKDGREKVEHKSKRCTNYDPNRFNCHYLYCSECDLFKEASE